MNRLSVILTVFTLFAMAPAIVDAQSANRVRAQQTFQSSLPPGVNLDNASLEQIQAAIRRIAATVSAEDFAELSGDMSYLVAEAQPTIAAQSSAAIVRSTPPSYAANVSLSVSANAAAASAGRPGASSVTQIAQQVSAAAAPRGGVPAQALGQAIVNSVPSAAPEIMQSMNLQVTVPASPIAPPSGNAPLSAPPGAPIVSVPTVDNEVPDPGPGSPNGTAAGTAGSAATTAGSGGIGVGAVATGAAVVGAAVIVGAIVSNSGNGNGNTTATNP